ncbi:MAG: nitrous oxide reductase accessory protein NosL [Anaerolineales bacterium]|nr:nitrous oxide reductase accessory protein NosL [Anaerolineales bacterium]MCB8952763.1 nitrous oxide reductase accessory protein NosL [Ardenticatenales bacterium]
MKLTIWRAVLGLLLLMSLFAIGCSHSPDTGQPPVIIYGEDTCDRCRMIIDDERFAAAYWTAEGQARRFDDIGGMVAYVREAQEEVASFWVHDYLSGEWLSAESATYVLDNALHTPMGFGILACADEAEAQDLAEAYEGARVLTWQELLMQGGAEMEHP